MSGHSKWHNIQARKGKQDALKSNVFSKYAKQISVAARNGSDPTTNFSLRLLIDKAKISGMPKDNIERAIKRGSGADGEGAQMEEVMYEAYGPGGTAILIKATTDNKNRTSASVKHIVSERGGSLGSMGSVKWMFGQWGIIEIEKTKLAEKNIDFENFELQMIDAGAEDIVVEEENIIIKTKIDDLQKVLARVKEIGLETASSSLEWIAKDKIAINEDVRQKLEKLFSDLEDDDDVDDYFTNAE